MAFDIDLMICVAYSHAISIKVLFLNRSFFNNANILRKQLKYIRKILNIIAGDSCVIQKTGAGGECLTISLCPALIREIRKGNRDHTVCGYEGRMQIVCCPLAATVAMENKVQHQPIVPASASNERISIRSKKNNTIKL